MLKQYKQNVSAKGCRILLLKKSETNRVQALFLGKIFGFFFAQTLFPFLFFTKFSCVALVFRSCVSFGNQFHSTLFDSHPIFSFLNANKTLLSPPAVGLCDISAKATIDIDMPIWMDFPLISNCGRAIEDPNKVSSSKFYQSSMPFLCSS